MGIFVNVLFWISIYVAFHLYIRLYQFTYVELFPSFFSQDGIIEKYVKDLSIKMGEKRVRTTLIVYSAIAILPFTILTILVGYHLGLIVWAGTVLFIGILILGPLEIVLTYRSTKNMKEKLLQLNSTLKEDPSTPITNNTFNLLIGGYNSQEAEVYQLTIEALELLKDNELIIKKVLNEETPKKSIHEKMVRRRTPSPEAVWRYLKKVDHLPVKRRGENVQRLSDEI
jgi:hypothetical protein